MSARSVFNIRDDAPIAIGLGLIKNVESFDLFGSRANLTADVEQDLSRLASGTIPLPSNAGQQLEVVSTNAADTQLIEFETLGPGGANILEFRVNLNGTTPVLLPEALISRINEVENIDLTPFLGTVSIQAEGGGTVFGLMRPEDQQLNQALFTIRSDKKWMIKKLIGTLQRSTGAENDVTLSLLFKRFDGAAWRRPFQFGLQRSGSSTISFENSYPNITDGPTDIKVSARSTVSGATASAWINGLLL